MGTHGEKEEATASISVLPCTNKAESNTVYPLSVGADISGIIVELTTHKAHGSYRSNNTHKAQKWYDYYAIARGTGTNRAPKWYSRIAKHAERIG